MSSLPWEKFKALCNLLGQEYSNASFPTETQKQKERVLAILYTAQGEEKGGQFPGEGTAHGNCAHSPGMPGLKRLSYATPQGLQ